MPKRNSAPSPETPPQPDAIAEAKAYARFLKSQDVLARYQPFEPPTKKRTSAPPRIASMPAPQARAESRATTPAPPEVSATPLAAVAKAPATPSKRASSPVAAPSVALPNLAEFSADSRDGQLHAMHHEADACRACALGHTRKNVVFGTGNPNADLVFIGEAPGAKEDELGLPFVGRSGNLLTTELEKLGIPREDVYICNILKCRPPDNRDPLPSEVEACQHFLHRQLALLKPRMLCSLGRIALSTLLSRPVAIMKIRGTWERYLDYPLFISLHPSAVLHQPQNRELFVQDLTKLASAYHARNEREPGT